MSRPRCCAASAPRSRTGPSTTAAARSAGCASAIRAREIIGIAHSIGALLVGGAHNSPEQAQLVMIGGHTGYYGDYHRRYRLPMTAAGTR